MQRILTAVILLMAAFTFSVAQITSIPAAAGGGGGAPTDAQYLVLAANGSLSAERVFTLDANMSGTDGGAGGAYTIGPDTAKILSRATDQAGTDKYCRSTTGNDSYTCTLTPTLTAYTTGMCLVLNGDTGNTTTATVAVDGLAAGVGKSILNRAGAALATGDITANIPKWICYDGTNFIIQGDGGGVATAGSDYSIQYRVDSTTLGGAGPGSTGQALLSQGASSAPVYGYIKRYERFGTMTNNGQAAPGFLGANVQLLGGANETTALAHWNSTTADTFLYFDFALAPNWVSTDSITLELMRNAGSGSTVLEVTIACVAVGEDITSPSYNAVSSNTYNIGAETTNRYLRLSFTPATTNCAAGELAHLRFARRGADAADTLTAEVFFLGFIMENNYKVQ